MILEAIFLGVLQGATEFLPVSSSGHLVLAEYFLGLQQAGLAFDVALHLGTLLAVVAYFRADFLKMGRALLPQGKRQGEPGNYFSLFGFIVVATLPGVLSGLLLAKFAESYLRQPQTVAFSLALAGLLLLLADRRGKQQREFDGITLKDAILIGLSQAVAIVPGVSRSGITIAAALFLGLNRRAATRFSFLLSAPIILGAGVHELPEIFRQGALAAEAAFFLSGFVAAALSGYLFIALLMKYIRNHSFAAFAYYRFALAGVAMLALLGF